MIILDTSACIDFLKGNKDLKKILSQQKDLVHVTAISIYEVNIGLEKTRRMISEDRYKALYKSWLKFVNGMEIFPFGFKEAEKSAKIYDKLSSEGQLIDDNDILIAGIMLSNGIKKIITKNIKHFKRIEQLEIIEY